THWSEGFAHQFFVCEWTVHFSGIEKRDAEFDRVPKKRDHLLLVFSRTVAKAHSHTAQPDGRDFQGVALSEFVLLHISNLRLLCSHLLTSDTALNSEPSTINFSAYSDFREAMSMEKRYFTSDLSNLSYASLTF